MNVVLSLSDVRRAKAAERFRARGVPHRRIEEWKYSDLRGAVDEGAVADAGSASWSAEAANGVELFDLAAKGEAPDWVKRSLGAVGANGAMDSASLAFSQTGFALRVARGHAVAGPLAIGFAGTGHVRGLIVLEDGASLTVMEACEAAAGLRNVGMEIVLGANAILTHIRVAADALGSLQVEEIAVRAAQGAVYRAHFANFGAKLSRLELQIALEGEGAEAHLSGVSVLGGEGHADVTTHIDHAIGNTTSTQLFKKVAGGRSRAIYQGKITVREGANGSDSRQSAKALLLGARAEADLKPELEILADDVKCAHGAAVGDLDTESLFYLRSRGVPEAEARNLLIRAFVEDAVLEIEDEALRAEVWKAVEAALPRAMEVVP